MDIIIAILFLAVLVIISGLLTYFTLKEPIKVMESVNIRSSKNGVSLFYYKNFLF